MDEEQKIVIAVDKSAADASLKAIKALENETAKLGASAKKLDKVFADSASSQKRASKEATNSAASTKQLNAALNAQTTEAKQAKTAIEAYEESLRSVQKGGADLSGDLASSFAGVRGAAGAVGLGAVADVPLGIAEAAADFGEFLPKLKVGLEATAASGSGVVSTIAGLAASALPAAGAGFGAIAVALAPIVLIAGAVAAAFAFVGGEMDKAQKAAVLLAEQERDATQAKNQAIIVAGATTLDLANEITRLSNQATAAKQDELDAQRAYDEYVANRSNPLQAFGDAVGLFGDQEQRLADDVTEATNRFQGLVIAMSVNNDAIQNGETVANDLAAQELALAEAREQDAIDAIAMQEAALRANEQTMARVAQLEQQRADLINNRAIQDSNAYANEKLERKFAQEDEKAELAEHLSAIADIRRDGAAKVAAIEQELASLPAQQAEALADIASKGTKELNKLSQDYFANQIKATKDFAKESGRIASDTAKAAKRLAEDLADNLADAARDNDVVAFLELQRDGQKELKRNAEDAGEAEKRRAEDFAQQQNEQRQAFQQRQQEILNNLAEERAQVAQSFAEKRAALELQRQQEILNTQQSIANANARYQAEQAREAQAADREKQRAALRQSQEDAAFQRQIKAINDKTNAELAGLQRVANAAAALGSSNKSATKSSYDKPSSSGGYSGGGKGGFSKGGAGNSGSTSIVVNAIVGDVATGSQVSNAINQNNQAMMNALIKGVAGAQGG